MTFQDRCQELAPDTPHPHEDIMYHMIANPQQSLKQVGAAFGYNAVSIYTVVHNDLFQARFQALKKEFVSQHALSVTEKLQTLAHIALDRWGENIENSLDPEYIKSSADKILQRLGYGATSGAKMQMIVNNLPQPPAPTVTQAAIEAANRARLALRNAQNEGILEGEFYAVGSVQEAQAASDQGSDGADQRAQLPLGESEQGGQGGTGV